MNSVAIEEFCRVRCADHPASLPESGMVRTADPTKLLTERYGSEMGTTWEKSRLRDRIDAVIVHEAAEGGTGTHESAETLAAKTELPVSEGTRRIRRAMAGNSR
jgi:hypothetical protein